LLRAALRDARLTPGQIGYLEAHGTGTTSATRLRCAHPGRLLRGSRFARSAARQVGETNIGHLEPQQAWQLIKVVASMVHEAIPPHLNFETPNPNIPWDGVPVEYRS
jgi:acyl transferase domain-containing protein